jgi:hypothetical protein
MNNQSVFFIDKRTGTSADTLLAAGVAELARLVLESAGKPTQGLRMSDAGQYHRVDPGVVLDEADIASFNGQSLVRHLDTASQEKALGKHYGRGFPYDEQRVLRDTYRAKLKELPPAARSPDARITGHPALDQLAQDVQPPDTLLPLYLVINQMKVASSFNEPVIRWRELTPELMRKHIQILFQLFRVHPNPLDEAIAEWRSLAKQHQLGDAEMTMLQVINPTTGKGANRSKANKLDVGGQCGFWLLELLKFAGFFALAHPQTINNSDDRKTYVLRPREIELHSIDDLMRSFRDVLWSSSPAKMDVLAALQCTRLLIQRERIALAKETDPRQRRFTKSPSERIQGFDVTFYKYLGSAFVVMNIATLNLPEWVPAPQTLNEAERIAAVLTEHADVIRAIRYKKGEGSQKEEERTEEYELLRRYRDFLSARSTEPFLDFAARFGPYVSQKIERGEYIRRFSVELLEELFRMNNNDFRAVIENEGFRNIADAIRRSTVSLQYAKGMKLPLGFEIRYGLMQELVRHANYPDDFVATLSEFIARYNAETAQKFETSKGQLRRKRVTEEDLARFLELLAQGFSSKTLARLLVAFGTAKASDETSDQPPPADSQNDTTGDE